MTSSSLSLKNKRSNRMRINLSSELGGIDKLFAQKVGKAKTGYTGTEEDRQLTETGAENLLNQAPAIFWEKYTELVNYYISRMSRNDINSITKHVVLQRDKIIKATHPSRIEPDGSRIINHKGQELLLYDLYSDGYDTRVDEFIKSIGIIIQRIEIIYFKERNHRVIVWLPISISVASFIISVSGVLFIIKD